MVYCSLILYQKKNTRTFKYHKKKLNTNINEYPWPVQLDKYALDRKMLHEDLSFVMVDRKKKMMDSDF